MLVKDIRKRYTANDVLAHPWISNAPETPLHTANNLFRNNSTKDIQQYNDHFNMNHFTNRLSARVEETIPSLGSTPEKEAELENNYSPQNTNDIVAEASKLLEQQHISDGNQMFQAQQPAFLPQHHQNDLPAMPVYYPSQQPPPLINMNGVMIYAPPMQPQFYPNGNNQYYQYDVNYYQQPFQQVYDPKFHVSTEGQRMKSRFDQVGRVNSNAGLQRSMTPSQLDNVELKQLQQHRGSLQLGLETCQNAMVRQVCIKM